METKVAVKKYFLTVDWCSKGKRGIFCSKEGKAFSQDHPYTVDEAWDILRSFDLILNPESIELTEEELKAYNKWIPLAEYSNQFGIVYRKEDYQVEEHIAPNIQTVPKDSGIVVPNKESEFVEFGKEKW